MGSNHSRTAVFNDICSHVMEYVTPRELVWYREVCKEVSTRVEEQLGTQEFLLRLLRETCRSPPTGKLLDAFLPGVRMLGPHSPNEAPEPLKCGLDVALGFDSVSASLLGFTVCGVGTAHQFCDNYLPIVWKLCVRSEPAFSAAERHSFLLSARAIRVATMRLENENQRVNVVRLGRGETHYDVVHQALIICVSPATASSPQPSVPTTSVSESTSAPVSTSSSLGTSTPPSSTSAPAPLPHLSLPPASAIPPVPTPVAPTAPAPSPAPAPAPAPAPLPVPASPPVTTSTSSAPNPSAPTPSSPTPSLAPSVPTSPVPAPTSAVPHDIPQQLLPPSSTSPQPTFVPPASNPYSMMPSVVPVMVGQPTAPTSYPFTYSAPMPPSPPLPTSSPSTTSTNTPTISPPNSPAFPMHSANVPPLPTCIPASYNAPHSLPHHHLPSVGQFNPNISGPHANPPTSSPPTSTAPQAHFFYSSAPSVHAFLSNQTQGFLALPPTAPHVSYACTQYYGGTQYSSLPQVQLPPQYQYSSMQHMFNGSVITVQ